MIKAGEVMANLGRGSSPMVASSNEPGSQLGDALASLGPWEGESAEDLMSRLSAARKAGGSGDLPKL